MASWGWAGLLVAAALAPCAGACALDAPLPPVALTATETGGGVLLDWLPPLDDGGHPVEAYEVYGLGAEGWALLATVAAPATSWLDGAPSVPLYQVEAVSAAGSSLPSPPASALSMCPAFVLGGLPPYPEVNWQCVFNPPTPPEWKILFVR